MEFIKLAQNRYSCRKFSDKAVEPEKLSLVLEAGRLSPTAVNGQPVTVKVLKSEAAIAKLRGMPITPPWCSWSATTRTSAILP